eukprot:2800681-Pleurochrysis_carterae.AAC.1
MHTVYVARSSRVLGGNNGYFRASKDCVAVGLYSALFGRVWSAVCLSDLSNIFDLAPTTGKLLGALGPNYPVRKIRAACVH